MVDHNGVCPTLKMRKHKACKHNKRSYCTGYNMLKEHTTRQLLCKFAKVSRSSAKATLEERAHGPIPLCGGHGIRNTPP